MKKRIKFDISAIFSLSEVAAENDHKSDVVRFLNSELSFDELEHKDKVPFAVYLALDVSYNELKVILYKLLFFSYITTATV